MTYGTSFAAERPSLLPARSENSCSLAGYRALLAGYPAAPAGIRPGRIRRPDTPALLPHL